MKTIQTFLHEETGASGAEVAMLSFLGLSLIYMIYQKISGGADGAASKVVDMLTGKGAG